VQIVWDGVRELVLGLMPVTTHLAALL
jgi:hypothetical protein